MAVVELGWDGSHVATWEKEWPTTEKTFNNEKTSAGARRLLFLC